MSQENSVSTLQSSTVYTTAMAYDQISNHDPVPLWMKLGKVGNSVAFVQNKYYTLLLQCTLVQ